MKRVWSFLPGGVREPLALLVIVGVTARTGLFDLYAPFALWPGECLHGRVWQPATYALLPGGLADLILNGFFFAMLGTRLVQVWGRGQFWRFCLMAAAGTAVVKLALTPFNRGPLVGIGGVIYAMFAAWYR